MPNYCLYEIFHFLDGYLLEYPSSECGYSQGNIYQVQKYICLYILINTEQNELCNHNWAYIFRQKFLYDYKGEMGAQKNFLWGA